jgi:hypothetical protein
MPRELKEIRNFNKGTMFNVSERDIPDNASSFSLNVSSVSEHGILSAIRNDRLFASSGGLHTTIATPISWGSTARNDANSSMDQPDHGYQYVQVNNIDFAKEANSINLKCLGTKGKIENLTAAEIRPWLEKTFVTYNVLDVKVKFAANVGTSAIEIPFLTNTNAISESISNFAVTGFTDSIATITISGAIADAATFVITSPDGKIITYEFDTSGTPATGALVGSNTCAQISGMSASNNNMAQEVKEAIEDTTNGHGVRISITIASNVLTLTYVHKSLDTYLHAEDYVAFVSDSGSGLAWWHEIIKIESVDTVNSVFKVKRACFGTSRDSLTSSPNFEIYANRITIPNDTTAGEDNEQLITKKGFFHLHPRVNEEDRDFHIQDSYQWSQWAGNHIGGNASFLHYASSVHEKARHGGQITTATTDHRMTFSAANKTLTMASVTSGTNVEYLPVYEGDTVTFYHSVDNGANNGFSAKVLKKVEAATGCVITFDTAPTDDTETSDTVYMEANLLQNHTLHHSKDQVSPQAQTIDASGEYKINHWSHNCYKEEASGFIGNEYGYGTNTTDANVLQVSSGGFWTTSNGLRPQDGASNAGIPADGAADQGAYFYPFDSSDKYMKLTSEFVLLGGAPLDAVIRSTNGIKVGENQLEFYTTTNNLPSLYLSKGDVIKMTNDITWEYMRIISIVGQNVTVERAIWGSSEIRALDGDTSQEEVWKCVNHGIHQKVSKDKLKPNQQYVLSFYAKDEDSNFTVANCDKTLNDATVDLDNGAVTGNPIVPGMLVTGSGVPTGTTVDSVTSTTRFEMSQLASDGTSETLTFYNPGRGGLSLMVSGGYIDVDGRFAQISKDLDKGHVTNNFGNITSEERWIDFADINKENGDIAVDINNLAKDNGLDGQWRKFSFTFTTPEKLLTDLSVDFSSKGPDGSLVSIDLLDLRENTILINNSPDFGMATTSLLDNSGIKDLVFWDSIQNKLGAISDVFSDTYDILEPSYNFQTSSFASSDLNASNVSFVANNREMHIGFGSDSENSSPQWLGYVNHKVFGQDFTNQLYQDEDTVHQYASGSAGSLSKICVAGEHEKLEAALSVSGSILTITHAGNTLIAGDNIVVREWGDVGTTWAGAGVWSVTTAADPGVICKRLVALDANPSNTSFFPRGGGTTRNSTTGYVCYRPYYYYGIRDGDYHIYRITPSDKINDAASDVDADYPAGTIERSQPLRAPLASICTCHSKEDETIAGFGGGKVYVMSNISGDIYAVDVQISYDGWETTTLADSIIHPIFKSFKWSNNDTDGDNDGEEVFPDAGDAETSSPTIATTGIMSDILETKGPNADYVHAADGVDDNDPDHFDTRLWIQFRPSGDDTFGEGARYLFCGKTNVTNAGTATEATIYFADRTPPSNVLFGLSQDMGGNYHRFISGVSFTGQVGHQHTGFTGDFSKYALFHYWRYLYWAGHWVQHLSIKNAPDGFGSYYDYTATTTSSGRDYPYMQWGYNTGWSGAGNRFPAVKVAKYGLIPMADNDNDGIIDGTGVVVPSTTSVGSTPKNPYGNLHQRVSAHAVGLIGGSDIPWMRSGGKSQSSDGTNFWQSGAGVSSAWNNGTHADTPEDLGVEKCIFICTDMHYGDFQPQQEIIYTATEDDSHNGQTLTKFIISATDAATLQAGDAVYIKSTEGSRTFTHPATIMIVESDGFTVDILGTDPGTDNGGIIYTHTPKEGGYVGSGNDHRTDNHGVASDSHHMFHYSFDKDTPTNGDIFTVGDACGHYSRKWYSKPNVPYGVWSYMPGILSNIERLDYRAGFMIRPFEATEDTFQDLVIGNNTAVDIPSMPDHVYHVKNSTALHHHVNDAVVNNQFASRMYVSSESNLEEEDNKSKIYICDLNFNYPHVGNHLPLDNENTTTGGTTDDFDSMAGWDILASGILKGTPYIYASGSSDVWLAGATQHPIILFTSGTTNCYFGEEIFKYRLGTANNDGPFSHRNGMAGLCLSIVDKDTGTTQTRYIVSSHSDGTGDTSNAYVGVHFPFGHIPVQDDTWYITHHSNICTAPIRLLKEADLSHSVGTALKADPILSASVYKNTGKVSITAGGLITTKNAGLSADVVHNLTTNDTITIAATSSYNDVFKITVTGPTTLASIGSSSGVETGTWTLVANSESSASNPIKLDIAAPTLKTMFGGLDMRKTKSIALDDLDTAQITVSNDAIDVNTLTDNYLEAGDTVTVSNTTTPATYDGTYIVHTDTDGDQFKAFNLGTDTNQHNSGNALLTVNQWESLISERGSISRMGELRSGFNSWDKGNIQSNTIRYDTDDNASSFMSVSESGIVIQASSVGSSSGDYFLANTIYSYKISFIYDGYQEGPLSSASWNFEDTVTRAKLGIKLKISEYSRRLSHVCLYRRDTSSDFYKLVEQVSTITGWAYDGSSYIRQVEDDGAVGASYAARTGLSEVLDTIKLKYGISTEIGGYLFAGDCSHSRIENASNMVFRSRPGMFSIFDYANDFLTLKSKPTAMANFNGRLYVFDSTNIYRVNPETLQIEDIFEGVGCLNKDAVIVTEYGMFFADKNGAYRHNGTSPSKISEAIQKGGDTTTSFEVTSSDYSSEVHDSGTTDNIKDVSWESLITNEDVSSIQVIFLPSTSSVLFTVNYTGYEDLQGVNQSGKAFDDAFKLAKSFQYIWSYNIGQERWDLWELSENSNIGKPFLGKSGELYIPIDESIYEYSGGNTNRALTWVSKRLSMDEDSVGKVFNKIKVNGLSTDLNGLSVFKESSQRLIVVTSSGSITAANTTYSSESSDHSTYRFSGANRKGRWIQFKLEDITEPIDSVGILFRRKSPK